MLVFMFSPVFVKKVWLCERGKLARSSVVVRSIVEPIWAGPSLRTIFINKNIVGYCGYIGLISFVAYRTDIAPFDGVRRRSGARPARLQTARAKHRPIETPLMTRE
jgi:hypothetical protein